MIIISDKYPYIISSVNYCEGMCLLFKVCPTIINFDLD